MTNHDPYAPFVPNVVEATEDNVEAVEVANNDADGIILIKGNIDPETLEAKDAEPTTPVESVELPPVDKKVSDVLDWVGADKNRARQALAAEHERDGKDRKSLVESLKDLVD